MKTSDKGLTLIKHFERLKLHACFCPANVWTNGYGHTAGVKVGDVISPEQADMMLSEDLSKSEHAVEHGIQSQFDTLVSFTFNPGAGNLQNSTLLKKRNAGGKKPPGLVERRDAERQLFLEVTA